MKNSRHPTIKSSPPCVLWFQNPFDLEDFDKHLIESPVTIQSWLDDHGGAARLNKMPTVCVYRGRELMRSEYDQVIDDIVCFVTLPTGGDSGTNPVAAVANLALALYAPKYLLKYSWATSAKDTLNLAGSLAAAGIIVAGSALINAVFPPPGLPNSAEAQQGSTTYSLQAQGNTARLGGPIPVNYGRMRIYPDFAAQPYTEYESNEQYLYQLFCIGQGENRISDIRLEDTPVENFEEVTLEIVPPLGKVTLFHTAVVTAPEAGGQDLSEPTTYGPYIINAVGTEISRVACDVVFPGGLIGVDEDDGDEYSVGVELNIFVEPVDDAGDVSGGSLPVFNDWIIDHTRTAIRRTLARDVPPDRYQMTIQRITGKGGNSEVRNCQLGAVKGYLVDDNEYGDITLLAMRVRATANLSDSASRLVNVLNERLIPVWNPDLGWSNPTLTRNPAWAFADAVRSRYGGDFPDDQLDLRGLHYLAGLFDSRGDKFDGRFDTDQSLWDALGKIGQVCRCGPVRHGNLIRLIRDQQIDTPVQQFSMANMSEFSLDYVMHNARTADSVKVTFWDEDRDYAETTILCQLPDDNADIPQDVTLFGCTQYQQAWREGMYLAASNRERRQLVSWKTEMEGHIPGFGDLVVINHDLLGAGQLFSGTVSGVEGAVLTLSRDVDMDGDNWYIILRNRLGEPSHPLPCEAAGSHQVRVLDSLPAVETDPAREPTHFMIGKGKSVSWPVKVTAITPEADDRVTIAGCIESEFVHTADKGEVPPPPPAIVPPPPGLDIEDLIATQGGTVSQPVVYLSWAFAPGADRYLIEYSRDGRQTWQPAGTGQSLVNHHEFTSEPGLITCRVAAVSAVRGDWALVDVNAGGDFDVPGKVQPRLAEPFTGNTLKVVWDREPAAARYLVEVLHSGTRARAVYVDRTTTSYGYDYTDAQRDGAGRTLTVKVLAQNAEGVSGPPGEVTATNPPPAVPDHIVVDEFIDAFAVRVSPSSEPDIRELRVWGSQASGFTPDAGNLQGTSTTTRVDINQQGTWYFRVAWVDNWGSTGLNYSGEIKATSGTVDFSDWFPVEETNISDDAISTPKLQANAVEADKIAAKAVTAEKISVNDLSAISANMGTLTAGTMKTDAAIGARVEITSEGDLPFWVGNGALIEANGKAYFKKSDNTFYSHNMNARNLVADQGHFTNMDASGTITGSYITGSVIEGSIFIEDPDTPTTIPTQADTGVSPRHLTFQNIIEINTTETVEDAWGGDSEFGVRAWFDMGTFNCELVSCGYTREKKTADGATWKNYRRHYYKTPMIKIEVPEFEPPSCDHKRDKPAQITFRLALNGSLTSDITFRHPGGFQDNGTFAVSCTTISYEYSRINKVKAEIIYSGQLIDELAPGIRLDIVTHDYERADKVGSTSYVTANLTEQNHDIDNAAALREYQQTMETAIIGMAETTLADEEVDKLKQQLDKSTKLLADYIDVNSPKPVYIDKEQSR